jgi:trans-2,3-dihydro-3-hydroxyanthranilate isomerase
MPRYRFSTCDVFTDTRFGGNQLAVLPEAEGLSDSQMQQIAREFNFSETTFVLPPRAGHDRLVRIFTPPREVPFAGHPNIGTAFVLAAMGELGSLETPRRVTFEEHAGLVPIAVHGRGGERIWCELAAPQGLTLGRAVAPELVAAAVSLRPAEVVTVAHQPRVASTGLPFLIAELSDRAALERARPDIAAFERLLAEGLPSPYLLVYTRTSDGFDIRQRMFAPTEGIPEDPATGSAACALAALLCHLKEAAGGAFAWRIAQGVEIGRPSVIEARAEKRAGTVAGVWVGGDSVLVTRGTIEV